MSRYTGPRARVSRRLGTNIFGTKGEVVAVSYTHLTLPTIYSV